ncbi:hypothetical protein NDU88_003056 [Pleurodeles waltl]|uniref:Uncharacterized protein n=1 Tax=Pleurodeles waltl TaxID=8319 RepID=A0AAV7PBL8_PLEWA|nr:hypothetical protein NDU88_003056 [Pleurodeles waltl]
MRSSRVAFESFFILHATNNKAHEEPARTRPGRVFALRSFSPRAAPRPSSIRIGRDVRRRSDIEEGPSTVPTRLGARYSGSAPLTVRARLPGRCWTRFASVSRALLTQPRSLEALEEEAALLQAREVSRDAHSCSLLTCTQQQPSRVCRKCRGARASCVSVSERTDSTPCAGLENR